MNDTPAGHGNHFLIRLLLGVVLPLVLIAIGVVPFLSARESLPERIATHFDLNGVADDSMTQTVGFTIFFLMIAAGVALLVAIAVRRGPLTTGLSPLVAATGGLLAGLGAAISSATAWTQQDIVDWQAARLPMVWIFWVGGLGVVAAALGTFLAAELPSRHSRTFVTPVEAMPLAPHEKSVWTSTIGLGWMLPVAIALLAGTAILVLVAPWPLAITALVVGLAMLSFSTIRVRADEHGLHIHYGPLGFPSTHIDVDDIEQASAIDVRPMEWGGWGYRGSLKLMRRAALVLRAGPGLRLDLTGGRTFVATVDEPETAAALLNAFVDRRVTQSTSGA